MASGKIRAISEFVTGLQDLRAGVKDDALRLLRRLDLKTLSNASDLADFLDEMVSALTEKHLVARGRVRPQAAALVRAYVSWMVKPR